MDCLGLVSNIWLQTKHRGYTEAHITISTIVSLPTNLVKKWMPKMYTGCDRNATSSCHSNGSSTVTLSNIPHQRPVDIHNIITELLSGNTT